MKTSDITKANISAEVFAHHIPFLPKQIGRIIMESVWNMSVRKKEIAADIPPLFSAVKKDDANMFIPESTNENAKHLNACVVICKSSAS